MTSCWPAADAWQQALRNAITDPNELLAKLALPLHLGDAQAQGLSIKGKGLGGRAGPGPVDKSEGSRAGLASQ